MEGGQRMKYAGWNPALYYAMLEIVVSVRRAWFIPLTASFRSLSLDIVNP
jgi:hypothetical protein